MKLNRELRQFAALFVIGVTIGIFAYYFKNHPEVRDQLSNTSISTLVKLLSLYMLSMGALALVTIQTLKLCRLSVKAGESMLITAYTAVINFFGPLQSGPAFRAVYLKKKYDLNLKIYGVAVLGYLFFWGLFSVLLLFSGVLGWWLVPILGLAILAAYYSVKSPRLAPRFQGLNLSHWYLLALATLLQIIFVVFIYFTELKTVAPGTGFDQAVIYTGAANLALFVSLTPGAIGFRESFLVFSQNLHHINSDTIVAANILDRAIYIVLLLILAAYIFGTHAQRKLKST